ACLYRLPRRRLQEVATADVGVALVSEALDHWIRSVYEQLSGAVFPAGCLPMKADETYELSKGETARSGDSVLWVRHANGASRLGSVGEFETFTNSGIFPLAPQVWLEAIEPVTLATADTATQLRSGELWSALPEFDLRIRRWASLRVKTDLD